MLIAHKSLSSPKVMFQKAYMIMYITNILLIVGLPIIYESTICCEDCINNATKTAST